MRSKNRSSKKKRFKGTDAEHARKARDLLDTERYHVEQAQEALWDKDCQQAFTHTIAASINAGGSRAHGAVSDNELIELVRDVSRQCIVSRKR